MADNTAIEWTNATWNPITGCTKVSPGCDHCYAETFAERWRGTLGHPYEQGFDLTLRPERLDIPIRWTRPRRIFVNSMSDLFHKDISDEYIARVFAVMADASQHTFQLLTKRHARMRALLNDHRFWTLVAIHITRTAPTLNGHYLPNVWVGVSVEDQQWADIRIPALLATPAAVRWISAEPLLGPVDLSQIKVTAAMSPGTTLTTFNALTGEVLAPFKWANDRPTMLDWVVAGGESGPGARPMDPEWARSLRDQCAAADVPFLFKQFGAHDATGKRVGKKTAGRVLDGRTYDGYPEVAVAEGSTCPSS